MKDTEYGLQITVEELEKLLEEVKNNIKYHDKESSIYIKNNTITQYCVYGDCFPAIWKAKTS